MLHNGQAVQVSDTTMPNQGSEPLAQNNTPVKEDWKEAFRDWYFGVKETAGRPPLAIQIEHWIETNIISKPLK